MEITGEVVWVLDSLPHFVSLEQMRTLGCYYFVIFGAAKLQN